MDAYLRDVGIEMQTYSVNGVPVPQIPRGCRDGVESYKDIIREMLIAYAIGASHTKPVWPWD
jgi:hypothetical protein